MGLGWLSRGAVSGLALAALASSTAACLVPDVVRVYDGVERRERYISDIAYAAYVSGAEHEARGEYPQASIAYRIAVSRDDESVDAWTRLGAVLCHLDQNDAAAVAFDEAQSQDERFEPLWRERALCAERRGMHDEALASAARAAALDPDRDDTVLLYARLLADAKRYDDAASWLRAVSLRSPASIEVWQAIEALSAASGDGAWQRHAAARLADLRARLERRPDGVQAKRDVWLPVDEALVAGDLPLARRELRRAHLDGRWLAARAIAVGRPQLAKAEAELRVGADPSESDARVALALAHDLVGDAERTTAVLAALPRDAGALTIVGRTMMGELLARHVGRDVASSWAPPGEPGDGAARDLVRRLRQRWTTTKDISP